MEMLDFVFRCHVRPNLSELILRRTKEMLEGYNYRSILCYDGFDKDYIERLNDVIEFDEIVMNPQKGNRKKKWRTYTPGEMLNRTYDQCKGNLIFHMENDWYWIEPCLDEAYEIIRKAGRIRFVKLFQYPIKGGACEKVKTLPSGTNYCIIRDNWDGYKFNLNPHLRRDKFPVGRFPDIGKGSLEMRYTRRFNETLPFKTAFLMKRNFIHLGVVTSDGSIRPYYLGPFWGENWKNMDLDKFDPLIEFRRITDNKIYIDLYAKYLKENNWEERWAEREKKWLKYL